MTEENKVENPVLWHVDIPEDVRSEFANVGGRKLSIVAFGIKRASQFKPHDDNWRLHPKAQQRAVDGSLASLGWIDAPIENRITGSLVDGHERIWNALKNGDGYVPYKQVELTEAEEAQALLTLDPIAEMAQADKDKMKSLMLQVKESSAGSLDNENVKEFLSGLADENRIENPFEEPKPEDPGADLNLADELQKKWKVQSGQLWQLGDHRLICGDCTDEAVVQRLMGGELAVLVHADPPYGMGKEKEGIENDNLYREKLDAFQMQWWNACRSSLEDNASAYIWGNAEDLWRLWYLGGLKDSERLTFRNETVWEKEGGQGSNSEAHRMYPNGSERALFFMLGEQNYGEQYWKGFDVIRNYLIEQKELMGWSNKETNEILGTATNGSGMAGHYFKKEFQVQWSLPTKEQYKKLQSSANEKAFKREYEELKREYEELKREYYSTRAYFENTHDLMTDVWQFNRVKGEERFGHATPKPVEMMERVLKSSSPEGSVTLIPFGGTCPEIIAAERNNRIVRVIELQEKYCSIILERWSQMTGNQPELIG